MQRVIFLTIIIVAFSVSSASADFYRWVDRDGKEFFTNEPQKIPVEYRSSAEKVKTDESRVSVENKPTSRSITASSARDHKDKYGRGESYWRKRAMDLRYKLRDKEDERAAVLKEINGQDQNQADLRRPKKKRANLEKKLAKIDKDIAKTRRKLEVDLPEEARKADAYPGWIRE